MNHTRNKRVIFELVYENGFFCQSRNFRLQRVGDVNWLLKAYNFPQLAANIDELLIVDASRGVRDTEMFTDVVKKLTRQLFVPLTLGGGVDSIGVAQKFVDAGADKVLVNSAFHTNLEVIRKIVREFGQQFLVAGVDVEFAGGLYLTKYLNGSSGSKGLMELVSCLLQEDLAGELLIQSIDRDGTGFGLDLEVLHVLPQQLRIPIVLAGGVGEASHIELALRKDRVSGVATANLLNFVGTGMADARAKISENGVALARFS
jgi:cyclase